MAKDPLKTLVFIVLSISFVTFVALFGRLPALRGTPISFLHRCIWIYGPSAFRKLDVALTNGRISEGSSRLANYLMNEKHPFVIIFFLGIYSGSLVLLLPEVWPRLDIKRKLPIPLLAPLPYIFTYLAAKVRNETFVTEDKHDEQMRQYPYDRMLYFPGMSCRTCHFLKPARSKHCSICKRCVARCDHHCVWVNNCIGRGNLRWFLALLLFTGVALIYGAYISFIILRPMVQRNYDAFADRRLNAEHDSKLISLFHMLTTTLEAYILIGGIRIAGVGLLAFLTWPMPLGLLGYHIYLIWAGTTTNETNKWTDLGDDMYDGIVFMAKQRKPTPEEVNKPELERLEPPTDWPTESRQALVRTSDGQPPTNLPDYLRAYVEKDSWQRCWRLAQVENIYDLGFLDNLIDALR